MRWLKIAAVVLLVPVVVLVAFGVAAAVWGTDTPVYTPVVTGVRPSSTAPGSSVAPTDATASSGLAGPAGAESTRGGQATAQRGAAPSVPGTRSSNAPASSPTTIARAGAGAMLWPVVGVTDGDTIRVRVDGRTERVRVIGIDTPELTGAGAPECFAQQAASAMQSLAQSRSVALEADPTQADRDRHGRLLRHVVLADGRLAAQVLIAGGFGREYTYAADYRHQAAFRNAQAQARSAARGIWSSACATPKAPAPAPPKVAAPAGSCDIKGNINGDGERIYHGPGGRSYDTTVISAGKGEKWFCSEAEATAAGWRAARG